MTLGAVFARPQRLFWVLALVFGSVFAVLTPMWQVADEPAHYMRAQTVAEGKLYIGSAFAYQEHPIAWINRWKRWGPYWGNSNAKITVESVVEELRSPPASSSGTERFEVPNNAHIYNPVPYLVTAATLLLTDMLELPILAGLWLARLGNLLVWAGLISLAIRVIPVFKYELLFVALLPMSLYQGMGVSADSLVNALSFLCFAASIRVLHTGTAPLERSMLGLAAVATFLVAISKQIYALPFVLLLCQKRPERWYRPLVLGILAISILSGALWLAVNQAPSSLMSPEEAAAARAQLSNPLTVLRVIWHSYADQREGLWISLIGVFGWLDTTLPRPLYTVYAVVFALMLLMGCEGQFGGGWSLRLGALAGLVIVASVLSLVMYMNWTHKGYAASGLQGRYYLAALPLLFVCCVKPAGWAWNPLTFIRRVLPFAYETLIVTMIVGGLSVSVYRLWNRFYI